MLTSARATAIGLLLSTLTATTAFADCAKSLDDARAAVKQTESAVGQAKESGKKAAASRSPRPRMGPACGGRVQGRENVRKQAEATREAREAQGFRSSLIARRERSVVWPSMKSAKRIKNTITAPSGILADGDRAEVCPVS